MAIDLEHHLEVFKRGADELLVESELGSETHVAEACETREPLRERRINGTKRPGIPTIPGRGLYEVGRDVRGGVNPMSDAWSTPNAAVQKANRNAICMIRGSYTHR